MKGIHMQDSRYVQQSNVEVSELLLLESVVVYTNLSCLMMSCCS
jgi:hypothetical protein